jgi:nitrogen fixation NifU-like protein
MDDLYRDNILDHYRNPRNFGRLQNPDISHDEANLVCGDKIGMDIKFKIKNQKSLPAGETGNSKFEIKEIRFFGEGCAISMASASMLTELVLGKSVEEIDKIKPDDMKKMLGIEPTPARLKCALLPLETLHKALNLATKA